MADKPKKEAEGEQLALEFDEKAGKTNQRKSGGVEPIAVVAKRMGLKHRHPVEEG